VRLSITIHGSLQRPVLDTQDPDRSRRSLLPTTQGAVGKANRTLENALLPCSAGKLEEWEQHLSEAVFSILAVRQLTTGFSSCYRLTGQLAQLPLAIATESTAPGIVVEAHDVTKSALPERIAGLFLLLTPIMKFSPTSHLPRSSRLMVIQSKIRVRPTQLTSCRNSGFHGERALKYRSSSLN
jgi:hypothetical protein